MLYKGYIMKRLMILALMLQGLFIGSANAMEQESSFSNMIVSGKDAPKILNGNLSLPVTYEERLSDTTTIIGKKGWVIITELKGKKDATNDTFEIYSANADRFSEGIAPTTKKVTLNDITISEEYATTHMDALKSAIEDHKIVRFVSLKQTNTNKTEQKKSVENKKGSGVPDEKMLNNNLLKQLRLSVNETEAAEKNNSDGTLTIFVTVGAVLDSFGTLENCTVAIKDGIYSVIGALYYGKRLSKPNYKIVTIELSDKYTQNNRDVLNQFISQQHDKIAKKQKQPNSKMVGFFDAATLPSWRQITTYAAITVVVGFILYKYLARR